MRGINKKNLICFVMCLSIICASSLSASASSGTQYGYSNFRLEWITTSTSASVTAVSGVTTELHAYVDVFVQKSSDGLVIEKFNADSTITKNTVTTRVTFSSGKIISGVAEVSRPVDSQNISTAIYN